MAKFSFHMGPPGGKHRFACQINGLYAQDLTKYSISKAVVHRNLF